MRESTELDCRWIACAIASCSKDTDPAAAKRRPAVLVRRSLPIVSPQGKSGDGRLERGSVDFGGNSDDISGTLRLHGRQFSFAVGDAPQPPLAVTIAFALWAVVWSFPWHLNLPPLTQRDAGFTPYAHRFFAEGRPWGTDTLHTSGIWGFLRFPFYDADTFSLFVLCHLLLAVLIGWYFAVSGARLPRWRTVYWGVAAALLPMLGMSDDARWYVPVFALLEWRNRAQDARDPLAVGLALAVALGLHTKGNFLIAAILLVSSLLVCDLMERRRPRTVAFIVCFALVLLLLGGGDLPGFGRHLLHVFESTSAYSTVFSLSYSPVMPALFLIAVMLASAARALAVEHRWQWPLASVYALLLFFLYKGAFVREDAVHVSRTVTAFVLIVATGAVARLSSGEGTQDARRRRTVLGLEGAALLLSLSPLIHGDVRGRLEHDVSTHLAALPSFLTSSSEEKARANEANFVRIRRADPLRAVDGSIAAVGTYQVPMLAHGLRPETIPIIAHYEVWTPRAAAQIDAYFSSAQAPKFVLRTSSYASAANELTLAQHYEPVSSGKHHVLLERRTEPLALTWHTVLEREVAWGESLAIPEEYRRSLLIAEVEVDPNLLGRVVGLLHHPAHVEMILTKTDGTESRIRINPALARDGIVVAGYEGSWYGLNRVFHRPRHPLLTQVESRVDAVTFRARTVGRDASALFGPAIRVRIRAATLHPR